MIRSQAHYTKSIPLFFLLASAASLAAASELPEKHRVRVEEIQSDAAPAVNVTAQAVQSRHQKPDRDADRGHGDRHRGDGDRHRGDGDRHRGDGDCHRGDGDRHRGDGDRHRGDGDRHRGDGDRHRGDGRWDHDSHRDQTRGGGWNGDRDRGGDRNHDRGGRWDNDRHGDRWDNDRHGDRWDNGRWDNDRHGRWDNDRRGDRWDNRRHGDGGHGSWGSGRRAWHDCDLRGGYYSRWGRYLGWAFEVPRFLTVDFGSRYDEYYYGSVYHSGLGRNVEVYLFPVYYNDRVDYVPYAYCEGRLYGRGSLYTGSVGLSIRFDF